MYISLTYYKFIAKLSNGVLNKEIYYLHYCKKVQVGKDQEKAQSEKDSRSRNRDGKKLN